MAKKIEDIYELTLLYHYIVFHQSNGFFFRLFLKQNGLEFIKKKKKPRDECRLTYTLNIIDTTGFGDTREIDSDQGTIDQIRQLFSERGANWVFFLLMLIFFIVKALYARHTFSQKHTFSSIMPLFSKDIESNIYLMIVLTHLFSSL